MISIYKKLWASLTHSQCVGAIFLILLMFIGMIFEMLGIGLIIPVLTTITHQNLYSEYPQLEQYLQIIGSPTQRELVIYTMLFLAFIYFLKSAYMAFVVWRQAKYSFNVQADMSNRLFKGYLYKPYTFHLQKNSAELIRNIISEVGLLSTVLQSVLMVISEILIFTGILILLLIVEPAGAILVFTVFSISGFIYYGLIRGHLLDWGQARQLHEGLKLQHLQQGLGGIKDIKILGREQEFISEFKFHNNRSAYVNQMQTTFVGLPRYLLELFAVLSLVILVVFMIKQNNTLENLVPVLGVFTAAAFRMMPSVNRLLNAYQNLRYSLPVVNTLYNELNDIKSISIPNNNNSLKFNRNITIHNVCYSYPDTNKKALEDISFKIPTGSTIGIIGTSGAGKSTLIDIILGLLKPQNGSVEVDDIDIQNDVSSWQNFIGYVPQTIYLSDDTLRRNIAFGLPEQEISEEAVMKAIKIAQLETFVEGCENGLNTIVGERGVRLSGGQRQRIGIARALYNDPDLLVLDEATSSLDTDTENQVMESVRRLHGKKTIIIIAHRLSTVKDCDYLYKLEKGKIISHGIPQDLLVVNQ